MKKKILISLSYYYPYISGLSEYARRLSRSLVGSDLDVDVICNRHGKPLPFIESIENVRVFRFDPILKINKLLFSLDMVLWSFKKINEYDVLIVNLPYPEAIFVMLAGKLYKKRIITVFHCDINLGNSLKERLLTFFAKAINVFCLLFSDVIVVNSLDYSKNVDILRIFAYKCTEIFPIIGVKNNRHAVIPKSSSALRLGYLGRISSEKNIQTLIEAVNAYKDGSIEFIIAGPTKGLGEDLYVQGVIQMVSISKNRINITGLLTEQEIEKFFSKIDFLVLASNNATESFGIVQVEAMLSGVPVIVSDLPGVRVPVLKTGAGYLVSQYNNPKEWVKAFKFAWANRDNLNKKTNIARTVFDPRRELTKWKRIIYEI